MSYSNAARRTWSRRSILLVVALAIELRVYGQVAGGTPADLKKALESDGFVVQKGKFKVIPLFEMYDAHLVPSCFGNNASSPYLVPMVPLAPGQTLQNLP